MLWKKCPEGILSTWAEVQGTELRLWMWAASSPHSPTNSKDISDSSVELCLPATCQKCSYRNLRDHLQDGTLRKEVLQLPGTRGATHRSFSHASAGYKVPSKVPPASTNKQPFISHKKEVISTRMGCNMTVFHLESKPSCIFFCISHLQSCVLGIYFIVCVITKKVIFEKTSALDFTGSPNSVFPRGNTSQCKTLGKCRGTERLGAIWKCHLRPR